MPRVALAPSLMHVCPAKGGEVAGGTVREALQNIFAENPALRSYVLDDQGAVRKHVTIFLDGEPLTDRAAQSDQVRADSEIFLLQALSGG
jgi:molybdopterin synthase sulfur carrier subunit